ncbi:translation initiation factor 2 [Methylobacterium sp. P1-11]|uniref:COG4223 family protein n=1 Tax=Methylobacterium sp. P1-11 TaxID=2024616 RepID=UPI0011F0610D|nr:translation initiation factor 2 [Methylobacterium sp. P1-11]KAA0124919.1 translation initiation factor 2 [Methylobacterium sp. P1-11]
MTPPPSDADKPGPGGRKPDAAPGKPGQPSPSGGASRPAATSASTASTSATSASTSASTSSTGGGGAKEPQGSAPGTPPKPATDPVVTAKPGTIDPKADAGKPASGADSLKPSTGPAAQTAGAKIDPVKIDPLKAGAAASSASDARVGTSASSSSTASTTASGPSGATIDPKSAQPGTGPQGGPRPGGPASGAAGTAAASAVTAGPIIDLKAKRIPDPPAAGREPSKDAPKDATRDTSRDGKEPPKGPIPAAAAVDPARSAAAPKARAGFGSLAAAGLLGGVIGAGLLFGAEKAGIGPDPRLNALDQRLSSQLASLDKRLDGLAPRDAVTALDKRVAAAEAGAKQALDKSGAAPASAADGQAAGQASGQAPAVPPDLVARLDSLDQRVAALQEEPGQEPGRDQPADSKLGVVQDNGKQIADLETRLKALEDGGANKGAAEEAARRVAALQSEVEQKTKANAESDAALGQRLDSLQQAVDARVKAATEAVQAATQASRTAAEAGQAQAAEAAKAVDRRLQEQADQIAALDKSVAQRAEASTVQAALRVVVADRVAAALESGASYAEPLATLRKLDPGTEAQAKALAPFADGGAPSAADLADTFRPISERIAAKRQAQRAKNAAETGDFRTKLLSMADGLVQIRKADAPAPEASGDPESKVQASLDRGDLTAASAAFAALPAEAQEQAGDFGAKLKARAEADQAVRTLLDNAFKALPVGAAQPAQAAPGR